MKNVCSLYFDGGYNKTKLEVYMFNYTTPEKKGISSASIEKYLRILEKRKLTTHDIIIMRGGDIVFEKYWAPFHKDFLHRMYSVTKSVLSLAVGFAIDEGYLSLDEKMSDILPDEAAIQSDGNMLELTVRDMLMMSTAKTPRDWFGARHPDRVRFYYENENTESRPGGTVFEYDSPGSFVLGAALERRIGMPFMDYLRPRLFDKIGVSKGARCLKCPGGHSWSDSALLCTAHDLLLLGKFVMNGGRWNGEQLLSESYVKAATSKQIDNNPEGLESHCTYGYGYLFWRTYDNSFFFNGMGCQFCVCVPDKDIIFVYNGDNQGNTIAKEIIIDGLFDLIVRPAGDGELEQDDAASGSLAEYSDTLKLYAVKTDVTRDFEKRIDGKVYQLNDNPMGIKELSFRFTDGTCEMNYTNAQGEKTLYFRINENEFGIFPEEGYSDEVGSQSAKGHYLKCAASAGWTEPQKLFIRVQIIDNYFGILNMNFGFRDENTVGIYMCKTAEDFLNEYKGYATGIAK